ncbi:hypothetical protein DVH24_032277 [Malus domestica]|uniref:Uncharacterized protein n=1 Tax=Malus domestica TaxID=3750 RepID=A0A498J368_MALDO|nr:hypothetical protein DVH24_032277 [Malus domestica]
MEDDSSNDEQLSVKRIAMKENETKEAKAFGIIHKAVSDEIFLNLKLGDIHSSAGYSTIGILS